MSASRISIFRLVNEREFPQVDGNYFVNFCAASIARKTFCSGWHAKSSNKKPTRRLSRRKLDIFTRITSRYYHQKRWDSGVMTLNHGKHNFLLSPQVSLDSRVREIVNRNMVEPTPNTFEEAQIQIYTLMHRDSYPRQVENCFSPSAPSLGNIFLISFPFFRLHRRFINSPLFKQMAQISEGSMASNTESPEWVDHTMLIV